MPNVTRSSLADIRRHAVAAKTIVDTSDANAGKNLEYLAKPEVTSPNNNYFSSVEAASVEYLIHARQSLFANPLKKT